MDGELALELLDELVDAPDRAAPGDDFAEAVLAGLSRNQKSIPCRFFYDARGSELFEQITALPEYYPTRVETELLRTNAAEIAWLAGADRVVVEFGSGSSRKTSLLLEALRRVRAYVPIDIAGECLEEAASWLQQRHPNLAIEPMIADFTNAVTLPPLRARLQPARLLLRFDDRQSHPSRRGRFSRQRGAAARQRGTVPGRSRSEEIARRS